MKLFYIFSIVWSLRFVDANQPKAKPLARREHQKAPEEVLDMTIGANGEISHADQQAKELSKEPHAKALAADQTKEVKFEIDENGAKFGGFDAEDEETNAALDELEAITIQTALAGKAPDVRRRYVPPRRRRRAPPRRRRAPPPPVNCQWGPWTEGECSKTCGGGKKTDTRTKTTTEAHGGTCTGANTLPNQECNDEDCPTTTTLMTTVKAFANRMEDVCLLPYVVLSMFVALNF